MSFDRSIIRAFDSETPLFHAGIMAPRVVCASTARVDGDQILSELIDDPASAVETLRQYLFAGYVVAFANAPYDLAVAAARNPHDRELLALIFKALDEKRIHDILTSQSLDAIYHGHLFMEPNGTELRNSKGEVVNRYSLDTVTRLVLGRTDAKANDVFRKSYVFFEGVPKDRWPAEGVEYPKNDAANTLEDAVAQIEGVLGDHTWIDLPEIPGVVGAKTICRHCNGDLSVAAAQPKCFKAPRREFKNQNNLAFQVDTDFCLRLGAAHSLRTDPEKVAKLSEEVEKKRAVAVERYQKKGWIRDDGTEDQAAVKRAVATAYGAAGLCSRCGGGCSCLKCGGTGKSATQSACDSCDGVGSFIGKIRKIEVVECRGLKVRGRYQGCAGLSCTTCMGTRTLSKATGEVTCKNIFDGEVLIEAGCDGTGLDLTLAPMLPRTDKMGVKTDRDTAMESGDEDVADYGENEFEKSRTLYIPYLRGGLNAPLYINSNVLVASGRCSYEGCPVHQFPRSGDERRCIRARGRWCGYPIEMVLGSTDYSAGELCTLANYTYWLFGYSRMRDAINASGDPGILHSELAAEVIGIPLEEFLRRLKLKDKQAVLFRQSSKPMNFGKPAAMGAAKIVLTNRKKNAGFTVCEGGPAHNEKGEPGYWGIRFCVSIRGAHACGTNKIMEWKKRPTPPVCKLCCEVVEQDLTPAYFRRFPEIRDYHKWGIKMVENHEAAPSLLWNEETGQVDIVRERGGCDLSAFLNNGFQSMLADIGKYAFKTATRECYLGVKADGSPSPLYGSRLPLFLHDEPLSELILETAHRSGPRIADIMVASGKKFAPDVTWVAKTALAHWWDKSMEDVYADALDECGQLFKKLVPWGPVPEYLKMAA